MRIYGIFFTVDFNQRGNLKDAKGYDSLGMLEGEQEPALDFSEQLEDRHGAHGR
jgi:hypothetical protein